MQLSQCHGGVCYITTATMWHCWLSDSENNNSEYNSNMCLKMKQDSSDCNTEITVKLMHGIYMERLNKSRCICRGITGLSVMNTETDFFTIIKCPLYWSQQNFMGTAVTKVLFNLFGGNVTVTILCIGVVNISEAAEARVLHFWQLIL